MTIILLILIVVLIILWLTKQKKLQSTINDLAFQLTNSQQENGNLSRQVVDLEQQNSALKKYQGIVDSEQKAKEIITDAEKRSDSILDIAIHELENAKKEANEIKLEAKSELNAATFSAKNIKNQANIDAAAFKQNSETFLKNASIEAKLIIEQADKKAQEIAGDAYKAMQNATELEKTAKAMKNIIEGYGDKYLVPTYSLLDDLAEEFGHTEAGEKLKFVREKTRLMINNKTSAKCDYVEAYRKETAINFILDAFNGKTDSILSKVKKDNFGTLEQKIKDAYQVVNNNGKAFRNAVITPEYLSARIDELKWAVIMAWYPKSLHFFA